MRDRRGNRACRVKRNTPNRSCSSTKTSSPDIDSKAVNGLVDPASPRFQTATKAPAFAGVIRAVRIRHCSFPTRATPDASVLFFSLDDGVCSCRSRRGVHELLECVEIHPQTLFARESGLNRAVDLPKRTVIAMLPCLAVLWGLGPQGGSPTRIIWAKDRAPRITFLRLRSSRDASGASGPLGSRS
jgi:hypothetical protein